MLIEIKFFELFIVAGKGLLAGLLKKLLKNYPEFFERKLSQRYLFKFLQWLKMDMNFELKILIIILRQFVKNIQSVQVKFFL